MDKLSFTTSNIDRIKTSLSLIASMSRNSKEDDFVIYGYKVEKIKPTEEEKLFYKQEGEYLLFTCSREYGAKAGYTMFPAGMHLETMYNIIHDWFEEKKKEDNPSGEAITAITVEAGNTYFIDAVEDFQVMMDKIYIGK